MKERRMGAMIAAAALLWLGVAGCVGAPEEDAAPSADAPPDEGDVAESAASIGQPWAPSVNRPEPAVAGPVGYNACYLPWKRIWTCCDYRLQLQPH